MKVQLEFRNLREGDPRTGLSTAAWDGEFLWTASDDGRFLERFRRLSPARFGQHARFPLPFGACDLEGMSVDDGFLWLSGSHSGKRTKPEKSFRDAGAEMRKLAEVKEVSDRCLLARIPLRDGEPVMDEARELGPALLRALEKDSHFGRFRGIPGKENGFDFEGLAVRDGRVFLGMRGPVLRGWACVLTLDLAEGARGLALKGYHKHFLFCDGLGIRELEFCGKDLLLIAGPTMVLEGPLLIFRWSRAWGACGRDTMLPRDGLEFLHSVPRPRDGRDRAEGLAVLKEEARASEVLLIYDNASRARVRGRGVYCADLLRLPGPGRGTLRVDDTM